MKKRFHRMVVTVMVLLMVFNINGWTNLTSNQLLVGNQTYATTNQRKADIVFVIDTTGSMGGHISNVKSNISQFVDNLNANNINVRLGLITYKDLYADGWHSTVNMGWYVNTNDFKNTLGAIRVGGGGDAPESAVDGLEEARRMSYNDLSKKFIVLVTDVNYKEGTRYDSPSRIYMSDEISRLKADNIVTSVIAPDYYHSHYEGLYKNTGGIFANINAGFATSLQSLTNMINTNQAPTLSISSPTNDQIFGQGEFIPQISVSDPDGDSLVCKYYIDSSTTAKDTKIITNTKTTQHVAFNSLSLDQLSEGNHTIKFEVSDNWDTPVTKTVTINVDKTPPQRTSTSIATTDHSISIEGSATDNGAGMHGTPYRYTVGSTVSAWTNINTYTKTGLQPNTSYVIKVETRDVVGNIGVYQENKYTKAQVPTLSISNPKETSLDISLSDANPSTTQYQILVGTKYVTSTGTLTTTPTWTSATGKKITVTGLTNNTNYTIKAKAKNQNNEETSHSGSINGKTLPSPPPNITTEASQRSITVRWSSIVGVTGYEIEADGVISYVGTSTTYVHEGLSTETIHAYRVRSRNESGAGTWSSLITTSTLPDPPATPNNLNFSKTQTEIALNWDTVPMATGYEIEVDGTIIDNGNSTSYIHKDLSPLSDHTYRVRAKNIGGHSSWGESILITTLPYPPVQPKNISAEVTKTTVALKWEVVEGATAYEIEVDGMILDNGNNTTYLHEGLEAYSGHSYRVRAKNAGGKSPWSNKIDVTTHPEKPEMPENVMTTADQDSISITWYDVPFAEDYEIEIDGSTIQTVVEPNFVHNGLSKNSTHSYRVRARNISGYSEWSNPVTMATMADDAVSLTNMVAVVTNNSIMLSWDAVAFEGEYEIEVDGVLLDNGKDTIYNHTGLQPNQYHTYKIKVKNGKSGQEWCAILSLSTLPNPLNAPVNIEATVTNNTVELRWEKVEGATGYDVEVDGVTIDNGTNESYVHENLEPGTAHIYRVRAKNITGVTAWSPSLTQSTTTPTYYVSCIQGKEIDFSLLASNVQDFSELKFVVTYNPNEVEVVDLYGFSPKADTITEGQIEGTNIYVKHTSGRIEFTVNKNIVPGTSWSGEITSVIFKAKIDGQTSIDFLVE